MATLSGLSSFLADAAEEVSDLESTEHKAYISSFADLIKFPPHTDYRKATSNVDPASTALEC